MLYHNCADAVVTSVDVVDIVVGYRDVGCGYVAMVVVVVKSDIVTCMVSHRVRFVLTVKVDVSTLARYG